MHDPQADADEAMHEYGVRSATWDELPRADAIVAAVAHREYRQLRRSQIRAKLVPGGCFVDVSRLRRGGAPARGLSRLASLRRRRRPMRQHRPPIRDRKIRFALVGCGRIPRCYQLDVIASHRDHLRARRRLRHRRRGAREGGRAHRGHRPTPTSLSMLARSKADCVILATPMWGLHSAQASAGGRRRLSRS